MLECIVVIMRYLQFYNFDICDLNPIFRSVDINVRFSFSIFSVVPHLVLLFIILYRLLQSQVEAMVLQSMPEWKLVPQMAMLVLRALLDCIMLKMMRTWLQVPLKARCKILFPLAMYTLKKISISDTVQEFLQRSKWLSVNWSCNLLHTFYRFNFFQAINRYPVTIEEVNRRSFYLGPRFVSKMSCGKRWNNWFW